MTWDEIPDIISTLSVRLVKWNKEGVGDLDHTEFIFNVGGDYRDNI